MCIFPRFFPPNTIYLTTQSESLILLSFIVSVFLYTLVVIVFFFFPIILKSFALLLSKSSNTASLVAYIYISVCTHTLTEIAKWMNDSHSIHLIERKSFLSLSSLRQL